MKRLVYGVGYNDAGYATKPTNDKGVRVPCPFYVKWTDMLTRCYCDGYKERHPTYIGCSVCDEWFLFSTFKKWMESKKWKGNQLDKDILIQGNKIYSPETCLFISKRINTLLTDKETVIGGLKKGVTFHKASGRFRAQCSIDSKQNHIGLYNTEHEAYKAYKEFKYNLIKSMANEQEEPIKSALLNYKID
tara:strand:- start:295 stop:864 length:570 start_codon:yes stop_codon:yes gene_type:complete